MLQISSSLPAAVRSQHLVLLFDDDPAVRESLEALLSTSGYRVSTAASGVGGISLAWGSEERPMAIVFDVMMADMDGFEIAAKLYQNLETRGIPLIMITTPSGLKDRRKHRRHLNFLTKPYRPSQLLEMLDRIAEGGANALKPPSRKNS
jgi:CheY-like chemotaxis protein